jgi:CDP-diacylglycerol--serine O-phosphatidyltransferase
MGLNGMIGMFIVCSYVLCAIIRLAFFNVLEEKRQKSESGSAKYYRGMPVTTISMILPPVYLTHVILSSEAFLLVLHGIMFLSALLFILDFPVKKIDWTKPFSRSR